MNSIYFEDSSDKLESGSSKCFDALKSRAYDRTGKDMYALSEDEKA